MLGFHSRLTRHIENRTESRISPILSTQTLMALIINYPLYPHTRTWLKKTTSLET